MCRGSPRSCFKARLVRQRFQEVPIILPMFYYAALVGPGRREIARLTSRPIAAQDASTLKSDRVVSANALATKPGHLFFVTAGGHPPISGGREVCVVRERRRG
jgi:hypothetical protein